MAVPFHSPRQTTMIEKFKQWWNGDLDLSEHLQDGDHTIPEKDLIG